MKACELVCSMNFRAAGHILEAVQVALVHVDGRRPVNDPFGGRLGDPRRMGHPHRFGHPEAAQVAVLTHDGEAVRGEREDAVERLLDLRIDQCGKELDASFQAGAKSSSVNGSIDGIASPAVSAIKVDMSTGIGLWL